MDCIIGCMPAHWKQEVSFVERCTLVSDEDSFSIMWVHSCSAKSRQNVGSSHRLVLCLTEKSHEVILCYNLPWIIRHVLVALLTPENLQGTKNTFVKRLRQMSCIWWETKNDALFLCCLLDCNAWNDHLTGAEVVMRQKHGLESGG